MSTVRVIWSVLTPQQRRSAVFLLALMLICTVLEMLSIGLVLPTLSLIAGEATQLPAAIEPWAARLGKPSTPGFLLAALGLLCAVYAIKSAFLLIVSFWQTRFVANVQATTSRRLFQLYLSQPWTFHLQRNSSELVRTINDVQGFAHICTIVILTLTELLVMCGLVGLLLWLEPTGTLVAAGLIIGTGWLYDRLARRRTRHWGELRRNDSQQSIKHLHQGLGGAKDVKIMGCERTFVDRFRAPSDRLATTAANQFLIDQVPRQLFELLAVIALLVLAAVMVWEGRSARALIPMLGLFATVAFRLLPSVNRMVVSLQTLHYHDATIRGIADELRLEAAAAAEPAAAGRPLPFADAITLESVTYAYPGGREPALHDVSLRIPHDASVGFVGGSGAGKSTLVDVILGLLPPTGGRVCVDGRDIRDHVRDWQSQVGYVAQSIYLCDDTIRANVAFGVPEREIDDAAVRRALKSAQLDTFVDELPDGLETFVGERGVRLSGGQRQRIGIARALYRDPPVLVLDEATSALDIDTEKEVMAAVNSLHGAKTLIIVAHRLSTVADCDLLYRLDRGRVTQSGSFSEVVAP
jgi:ABC-type multidrug transport system fused ATPase/permease subunit